MMKAYDVMTRSLATCAPDARVAEVAAIMRDRDIGDVLIVEHGHLKGIVTDRDLAIQALTGKDDMRDAPVHKYMSSKLVTGEPNWDVEKVSDVMAKHKVRRLPIVEHGQLVGMVTLGDVALHTDKRHAVADSLKGISKPNWVPKLSGSGHGKTLAALGLVMAAGIAAVAVPILMPNAPEMLRKTTPEKLFKSALNFFDSAREKMDEVAPGTVQSLTDQMRTRIRLAM